MSFKNFKEIQDFYTNFHAISRVQAVNIDSRLFNGFKEPWEPLDRLISGCSLGAIVQVEGGQ